MTSRKTRTAALALFLATLGSLPALASNMGFKKVFSLAESGANNHPISVPYFYTPTDGNANGFVDSQDMCVDLNGGPFGPTSPVQVIKRYNVSTDTLSLDNCATGTGFFPIVKGAGYFISNQVGITINSVLVGSHDDTFTINYPPLGANNNLWSLPYHIMLTDQPGSVAGLDSYDLCFTINGGAVATEIQVVKRYNTATDTLSLDNCATGPGGGFPLIIGTGYFLSNVASVTIDFIPPHY